MDSNSMASMYGISNTCYLPLRKKQDVFCIVYYDCRQWYVSLTVADKRGQSRFLFLLRCRILDSHDTKARLPSCITPGSCRTKCIAIIIMSVPYMDRHLYSSRVQVFNCMTQLPVRCTFTVKPVLHSVTFQWGKIQSKTSSVAYNFNR